MRGAPPALLPWLPPCRSDGAGAAGHRDEEGDLVAVREPLVAHCVHAADDGQRRLQAARYGGLELAKALDQRRDGRVARQLDAEPARAGRRGEPAAESDLDLHRTSSGMLLPTAYPPRRSATGPSDARGALVLSEDEDPLHDPDAQEEDGERPPRVLA